MPLFSWIILLVIISKIFFKKYCQTHSHLDFSAVLSFRSCIALHFTFGFWIATFVKGVRPVSRFFVWVCVCPVDPTPICWKNYPFSIGLPLSVVFYWKSLHSWCCGKILNFRWAHWGPEEGLCESSRNVLRACGTRRVYSAGATTHWHTLGLNSGRLCLTVLEATSPRWRYQQACFSWVLSPWAADGCPSLCVLRWSFFCARIPGVSVYRFPLIKTPVTLD